MQLDDPVDEFLTLKKLPKTRENYLTAMFLGAIPETIAAEVEAALPDYAKKPSGELAEAKVSRLSST